MQMRWSSSLLSSERLLMLLIKSAAQSTLAFKHASENEFILSRDRGALGSTIPGATTSLPLLLLTEDGSAKTGTTFELPRELPFDFFTLE